MFQLLLKSFYFILPAYFANMAPVIFAKFGWLNFFAKPVDGGRKFGERLIFGENKTWRGILSAIIFGILTGAIQRVLFQFDFFREISLFDYSQNFLLFGFLSGLGAMAGDLLKSFCKRRLGIGAGRPWPVFDQLDFVLGALATTYFLVRPESAIIVVVIALTLILDPLINIIGYALGIKKVWW